MNKPAVCIATIRPEQFKVWLEAWQEEFEREGVEVFVMVDQENIEGFSMEVDVINSINKYSHQFVADELKDKAWIIPKKTSACKSFAIYQAWKAGCDPIMVLDDDCLPKSDWIKQHRVQLEHDSQNDVFFTIQGIRPRGVPHIKSKPIGLSHGLWTENLDIDAATELASNVWKPSVKFNDSIVPQGCLFPMSGMNIAFRREIAPLMYFGLQGPDWGVDRFDDIWAGFLAKKVLDHCGYAVWSGTPYVRHVKASDPFVNIVKEAPGYRMNVELYQWVMNGFTPTADTIEESLGQMATELIDWMSPGQSNEKYWQSYGKAILTWLELFEPEPAFGI